MLLLILCMRGMRGMRDGVERNEETRLRVCFPVVVCVGCLVNVDVRASQSVKAACC
jgi:hypothetical protein